MLLKNCPLVVMSYILLLWLWFSAFSVPGFLIYSLFLLSILWTWNTQQRWSLFIHLLWPMFKKCKLSLDSNTLMVIIRTPLDNEHFYTLNVFPFCFRSAWLECYLWKRHSKYNVGTFWCCHSIKRYMKTYCIYILYSHLIHLIYNHKYLI